MIECLLNENLFLVKIDIGVDQRHDLLHEIDHFKAKTVDLTNESVIIEVSGDSEKVEAFYCIDGKIYCGRIGEIR